MAGIGKEKFRSAAYNDVMPDALKIGYADGKEFDPGHRLHE